MKLAKNTKRILAFAFSMIMIFSFMAMSASASTGNPPGNYQNILDANGDRIYFYSTTTGLPSPHAQDFISYYTINDDGSITLHLVPGLIQAGPYNVTAYFSYLTVTYTNSNGVDVTTSNLILDLNPNTHTATATIPAVAVSGSIFITFATNDAVPEGHTSDIILKLDYLP